MYAQDTEKLVLLQIRAKKYTVCLQLLNHTDIFLRKPICSNAPLKTYKLSILIIKFLTFPSTLQQVFHCLIKIFKNYQISWTSGSRAILSLKIHLRAAIFVSLKMFTIFTFCWWYITCYFLWSSLSVRHSIPTCQEWNMTTEVWIR